jgi:hypothetical protein
MLAIALVLLTTIASGVIHGRLTNRWGTPVDLANAGKRLQEFPAEFGDWKLAEDRPLTEPIRKVLQCAGYVSRIYTHESTGQAVHMVLLVGPPGPTSVHIPEVCYSSQDYRQQGPREAVEISGKAGSATGSFWSLRLQPNGLEAAPLQSYYAWSDGGKWQAAQNPRFTFGGKKLLYKLQLASAAPPTGTKKPESATQPDAGKLFLQSLLETGTWPL